MGFINLIVAYLVAEVLVYFLLSLVESTYTNCCTKKLKQKMRPHRLSNTFLRFMLEALLEILFVCMISLVASTDGDVDEDQDKSVKTPGDKFMVCYTVFLLLMTFGFVCAVQWYIGVGFKNLQKIKSQKYEEAQRQKLIDLY